MKQSAKHFWEWFKEHNSAYLFLNDVDSDIKQNLLDTLQEKLSLYCDRLYFEIGGFKDERQELIITAEGEIDYFDMVDELVNAAPQISNWSFIAFIPPRDTHFELDYEGVKLSADDMYFDVLENSGEPDKLGIRVFTRNFEIIKDSEWLKPAVYKVLDTVLGEKSFAMDVDYVDIEQLSDDPQGDGLLHLSDLPRYISWKRSKSK